MDANKAKTCENKANKAKRLKLHKDHSKVCQFFGRTLACIALTALTGWPLSWRETMPHCSMRTAYIKTINEAFAAAAIEHRCFVALAALAVLASSFSTDLNFRITSTARLLPRRRGIVESLQTHSELYSISNRVITSEHLLFLHLPTFTLMSKASSMISSTHLSSGLSAYYTQMSWKLFARFPASSIKRCSWARLISFHQKSVWQHWIKIKKNEERDDESCRKTGHVFESPGSLLCPEPRTTPGAFSSKYSALQSPWQKT